MAIINTLFGNKIYDNAETDKILDDKLPKTKRKVSNFLGYNILLTSRFNNYFPQEKTDVTQIYDKKQKEGRGYLFYSFLKHKFRTITRMRSLSLDKHYKDEINDSLHKMNIDSVSVNIFVIKMCLLITYLFFCASVVMTYLGYIKKDSILIFSTFIITLFLLYFAFLLIKNIKTLISLNFDFKNKPTENKKIIVSSKKQYDLNFPSNGFAEKSLEYNFKIDKYKNIDKNYEHIFGGLENAKTRYRYELGLTNAYRSDILIPFIPNYETDAFQKEYRLIFLENVAKINLNSSFKPI